MLTNLFVLPLSSTTCMMHMDHFQNQAYDVIPLVRIATPHCVEPAERHWDTTLRHSARLPGRGPGPAGERGRAGRAPVWMSFTWR